MVTQDPYRTLVHLSLAGLLLLAACEDGGDSPTAPSVASGRPPGGYDRGSLSPSLFARGARRAPVSLSAGGMVAPKAPKPHGKPASLANGSFELNGGAGTSRLDQWIIVDSTQFFGSWWVQTGSASPFFGFAVDRPTDRDFAAMTEQSGPGLHILYQDVVVPPGQAILSFDLYLENLAVAYYTPATLSPDVVPNQQFRVDIMDPAASLDDVGSGVLLPVYHTAEGDSGIASYQTISVSLRQFAGRTVRLRLAEVDNQSFFLVGVDRMQLGHKPRAIKAPKQLGPGSATATPVPFAPETEPTANMVLLHDDERTGLLPIGFEFEFFGVKYTQFNLSSNGFLTFDDEFNPGCCTGGVIPSDDGLNALIALAWTDLYPTGGGRIAYEVRGSGRDHRLVISYTDVPWCCDIGVPRLTTQVVLHERKGVIEIHTTHQDAGHTYTQGVENGDGTVAAFLPGRVAANYGLDQDAVRFTTSAQ
jgi:hypothetical protein